MALVFGTVLPTTSRVIASEVSVTTTTKLRYNHRPSNGNLVAN